MNNNRHSLWTLFLLVMVLALAVPLLAAHETAALTGGQVSLQSASGVFHALDTLKAGIQASELGTNPSLAGISGKRAGENTLEARRKPHHHQPPKAKPKPTKV